MCASSARLRATRKQPVAAGLALVAYDVQPDGKETVRLRAHGAAPAVATHGAGAPAHAPHAHTD